MDNVQDHYARKAFQAKRRLARLKEFEPIWVQFESYGMMRHSQYHYSIPLVSQRDPNGHPVEVERCSVYPSTHKWVFLSKTHEVKTNERDFIPELKRFILKHLPPRGLSQ